jgi:mevalonate kinase
MALNQFEASAPAKIILFGEHAVVYGQAALAAPIHSLRARVTAELSQSTKGVNLFSPHIRHPLAIPYPTDTAEETPNSLVYAVQIALQHWGLAQAPNVELQLNSEIPLGRGLGSGAAVATALIRALAGLLELPLTDDDLNTLVYEVEKKHHGTPSGIDNTVIVYEKPVYFVRGQAIETVNIAQNWPLLVADTGYGTPTHITVGDVRRLYDKRPEPTQAIFERIGAITQAARQAIEGGHLHKLGALMNENHELLQKLAVSSVELDVLCEAALGAGAYGAKMSGGGRGGNMLVYAAESLSEGVIRALQSAGATRVIKTRLRGQEA